MLYMHIFTCHLPSQTDCLHVRCWAALFSCFLCNCEQSVTCKLNVCSFSCICGRGKWACSVWHQTPCLAEAGRVTQSLGVAVQGVCVYSGSAHFLLNKRTVAKLQRNSDHPFTVGNILKCCLDLYRSAIQVSHNWNFRDVEIILLWESLLQK